MTLTLIEQNRALWANLRNYLLPMTLPEVRVEYNLADNAGDDVRRDLIDEYISREFCIVCSAHDDINEYGECPDCEDAYYDDEDNWEDD
jgi:hypothetical protein